MKNLKILLLSVLIVFAFSCGSDDTEPDTSLQISDLVGSWRATTVVHTNNSNSSQTYDVIANGGDYSNTMLSNGGVRIWVNFGTFSDEWDAGSAFSGNTVTLTPVETTRPVAVLNIVMLNSNSYTATNTNATFDFTLTGQPAVSTTSVTTWVRK